MTDEFKNELKRTGHDLWEILKYSGSVALVMTAIFTPAIVMNAVDQHYATKRMKSSAKSKSNNTSRKKKYYYTDTDDILSRKDRRDLGLDN